MTDRDSTYSQSLKSLDTEEHIDLWFYRPIGYAWARLAARLGVTPNVITIASIFLGIAAGICFYPTNIWVNLLGMFLLVWANSFDSADGQLARMTHQYSRLGRILDGLAGDFWFVTIYLCICLRCVRTAPYFEAHHWAIWTLAVVTGICHAKQAAMADYYRQFHLFFLKGKDGSELENSAHLRQKYADLTWRRNFWQKLIMSAYLLYTRQQEATTPAMQALRRELVRRYGSGRIPEKFRDDFRRLSLPLMKWTNVLSFNWRSITLFAALLLRIPWAYFVVELTVFNVILIYMIWRHERLCRQLLNRLKSGCYD